MTKSLAAALLKQLREVNFLLRAQAREIANLRASTDIQFKRIAQMQAELDVMPGAAATGPLSARQATPRARVTVSSNGIISANPTTSSAIHARSSARRLMGAPPDRRRS